MFIVLDTNHFTEIIRESPFGQRLVTRIAETRVDVFVTVITAQETIEGWLALVKKSKSVADQVKAYLQFRRSIETLAKFSILDFDTDAAMGYAKLRKQCRRIGSMDLKIAAICMEHEATLLTRNLVDFQQVPELKLQNWLD